jgi:diguanylate cyclase (GGDEF)-like protein
MIEAPLPPDEDARLRALRELGLIFTPAEERFDRLTRLAARLLHVPIALISLVDSRVQWFKASHGLSASESPRTISFCAHAILGDDTLVVRDALEDERFRNNPLVTGEPFIRFYAGHPLRAADGSKVGTFCVIDTRPRRLSAADLGALRDLASMAEDELRVKALSDEQTALIAERDELKRRSMLDSLTRTWNREAIVEVLGRELARAKRSGVPLSVIMVDVDHFKAVNDSFGHPAGDAVLRGVVSHLRGAVRPYDALGRYGGEEFLVVLPNCDAPAALAIAERMRQRVGAARFASAAGRVRATLSLGVATRSVPRVEDRDALIEAADRALYQAKASGRNRAAISE